MTTQEGTDPVSRTADPEPNAEPFQVLGPDGTLTGPAEAMLPDHQVREVLRWMLLSRALDEKCTRLHRQGRLGLYASVLGQEAAVIGSHLAIDPARDWLVPASREQPAMLRHGWGLDKMLASYLGRIDAARIPDDLRMLPRQQSIATQLPHAVGIAWARAMQGLDEVVLVYCGDGAASEGDFHEACNLAGVMDAPVIFVILNNQYAISTHVTRQTRARHLAHRARGYGFPGHAVDGNDVFAVHHATQHAVDRARAGHGPTLIEAITYRLDAHNTSDNTKLYREDAEVHDARTRDPLDRLINYATRTGTTTPDWLHAHTHQARDDVDKALQQALAYPTPGPEDLHRHIYGTP